MISLNNISFYFGSRALYEEVSLHIKPHDKIGLIGPNGAGKSTLLKIITGEYKPDGGDVSKAKDCSIAFLNQDLLSFKSDQSILEVAMEAFERENEILNQINKVLGLMETNYEDKLVDRLSRLQDEYEQLDGYTTQSRAEEILEGLGFTTEQLSRPLENFSGGWRMRVILAKMLLTKPSLLMLDEPTNHLDLPAIEWLEDYLLNYEGAVIVVSHDRAFLDNCSKSIAEVSRSSINVYSGNYTFYLQEKELRDEIQRGAFKNQQQQIKQTEQFINRFKAKATKARQVQSRVKALDKLEKVEDVVSDTAAINFSFNFTRPSGKVVMELKGVSKSYGDVHILKNTDAVIKRGDKIALIGANGKGKSTLLRIISGGEEIQGEQNEGYNVSTSFFAQHQLESLTLSNDLVQELVQTGVQKTELELRNILGCFLFSSDDVKKKIKVLSGGERSRVALAKTLISESNFLLLDEPTNHLDMVSVSMLTQALQQYEGTFITVSHNRDFITHIANKIWYIEDHQIKEYPGTYEEYKYWIKTRPKKETTKAAAPKVKEKPKVEKNNDEEQALHKQLKTLKNSLFKTEEAISKKEQQKTDIETELSKPSVYSNPEKLSKKTEELEKTEQNLKQLSEEWDELALEIDSLETELNVQ